MDNIHIEYNDNIYYEPLVHYSYGVFDYDEINGYFFVHLNYKLLPENKFLKIQYKKLDK